jgi:hypothetical protein
VRQTHTILYGSDPRAAGRHSECWCVRGNVKIDIDRQQACRLVTEEVAEGAVAEGVIDRDKIDVV